MSADVTAVSGASRIEPRRFLTRLFVPAAGRAATPTGLALGCAAVLVSAALSLLRQPGVPATNTIWAEDGEIFLTDAVNRPFLDALSTSYNGYYMSLQRILAEPITWFPATSAAALFAVEAALANALFAVVVYVASAAALRSRLLRVVAAAVTVLPPVGMAEILNNLSNVHWAGLYALFWVALWVPASRAGRTVAVVVAVAAAFTNILVVVFVPLLLVRLFVRRDWLSGTLLGVVAAGLALDMVALANGTSFRVGGLRFDPQPGLRSYFTRVLPSSLLGEGVAGPVVVRLAPGLIVAGVALVVLVVALGIHRRADANWPVAVVAWLYSGAIWVVAGSFGGLAPRYAACSAMLIIAGLAALVAPAREPKPDTGTRTRVAQAAVVGFAVLVAASIVANFRVANVRMAGPEWSQAVAAAQRECGQAQPQTIVKVPIAPQGWTAALPCSYLRK